MSRKILVGLCLLSMLVPTGCAMNHTRHGAIVGTGLGAVAGTIVGAATGNPKTGAVLGALVGGVAGGSIGHENDVREFHAIRMEEQAMHMEAAAHFDRQQHHLARALTEGDVINMAHSGVGDELIIATIRDRAGRFHMSPETIIMLKQQGVSDRVIQSMMLYNLYR